MKAGIQRRSNVIFCLMLLSIILFFPLCFSSASNASYGVNTGDSWIFLVKKANRYFEYSFGNLDFTSSTQGYQLGDSLVPLDEEIQLKILSIDSTAPETILYQVSSTNNSVTVNRSTLTSMIENNLQESLGQSVLGEGYNFLESDSGISVGNWVFIVPVNLSWSSLIKEWNKSVSSLPGALEGLDTILELDADNNEKYYQMWIKYNGTMLNSTMGIDFLFTYTANFMWEKSTGVLLAYEISTHMTGKYEQTFNANFALNLKLERSDLNEVLNENTEATPGFEVIIVLSGLITLIACRCHFQRRF